MKEEWRVYGKKADFKGLSQHLGIDQVTARIIRNRNVESGEEIYAYLYGGLSDCPSPFLLKDMDETVDILGKKIHDGKPVRIIGDYDVDGVCAT